MSDQDVAKTGAGFFGKLPSKGDFVRRNLPSSLIDACDSWLQQAMVASREALGERWLDYYLRSPIWRFALGPRCLDDHGWCGALMPSVDRVNRYFPLLIACPVNEDANCFRLKAQNETFFDRCEQLLITALDDDALDLEAFTAEVADLKLVETDATEGLVLNTAASAPEAVLADGLSTQMDALMLDFLHRQRALNCSLWWSAVDEERQRLFLFNGMPETAQYTALLTGTLTLPVGAPDETNTLL